MSEARRTRCCACLLTASLWVQAPGTALSQDERDAQQAPAEPPASPSQETDISEDNYRSYMELRDQALRRVALPTPQSPDSGLEKMERLPDASQRHLRDQLREIITTRGPWTPAAVGDDYPFVPSPAARANGTLRSQEAEAWSELVAGYHAREAEIAAGRARTGAATVSGAALGAGGDDAANRSAGGAESAAAPQGAPRRPSDASPARSDPRMNEGVSQSALEFLTGRGDGSGNGTAQASRAGQTPPGGQPGSEAGGPAGKDPRAADAGQDSGDAQATKAATGAATNGATEQAAPADRRIAAPAAEQPRARPVRPAPPEQGTSESALEYLAGKRPEDVPGEGAAEDDGTPAGPATLSLEALRAVPGIAPAPTAAPDAERPGGTEDADQDVGVNGDRDGD